MSSKNKDLCSRCRYREQCARDAYYCPPFLYFYDFYRKIEAIEDELRLTLLKIMVPRAEKDAKKSKESEE